MNENFKLTFNHFECCDVPIELRNSFSRIIRNLLYLRLVVAHKVYEIYNYYSSVYDDEYFTPLFRQLSQKECTGYLSMEFHFIEIESGYPEYIARTVEHQRGGFLHSLIAEHDFQFSERDLFTYINLI